MGGWLKMIIDFLLLTKYHPKEGRKSAKWKELFGFFPSRNPFNWNIWDKSWGKEENIYKYKYNIL